MDFQPDNFFETVYFHINPSTASGTMYVLQIQCIRGQVVAYVPQKQFWIIALLTLYSMISHHFPLAASFSNTVNTMEENGNS